MPESVWALILRHASTASVEKYSLLTTLYLRLKEFNIFNMLAVLETWHLADVDTDIAWSPYLVLFSVRE